MAHVQSERSNKHANFLRLAAHLGMCLPTSQLSCICDGAVIQQLVCCWDLKDLQPISTVLLQGHAVSSQLVFMLAVDLSVRSFSQDLLAASNYPSCA
jgi:hypothetical protein